MSSLKNQVISTVSECMSMMAPFAGGSVPGASTQAYLNWLQWIQNKQNEYAVRGFWRRLLKKATFTFSGETTVLPDDFHKANGLYIFEVDGVDWAEEGNTDGIVLFVEMNIDSTDEDYGKWQVRFPTSQASQTATIWYFAAPPVPAEATDLLILPGDMIAYGALIEYFREARQDGSMDKAEQDAENRFNTYISMEMIPPRYELLSFATHQGTRKDRLLIAKEYYKVRTNRNLSE